MLIYRLEDKDGRGPYTSRILREDEKQKYVFSDPDLPNGAREDFKGFGLRHVCGFETLYDVYAWFGNSRIENLIAKGFRLCYYEVVPEAVLQSKSGRQVAFVKECAKGPFYRVDNGGNDGP